MLTSAEQRALRELPKATPHPLLEWYSPQELVRLVQEDPEFLAEAYEQREKLIQLAEADPFNHGFDLEHWIHVERLCRRFNLVYVSGGKRASKSEKAAKMLVQAIAAYGNGKVWVFQDSLKTSISMQQSLVFKYFPAEWKKLALSSKRSTRYKLSYNQASGFTMQTGHGFVLPNRTEVHFLTYNQDNKEYQGWEIGAPRKTVDEIQAELKRKNRLRWINRTVAAADVTEGEAAERFDALPEQEREDIIWQNVPYNIGAWADENLTVPWLETIKFRSATRGAKTLWTFSTTEGITPTIKEVVGSAKTIESRPSELLPDRINVPDCPPGHMPFIQYPQDKTMAVIYFFTEWNPFSGYNEPEGVRDKCLGKSSDYIMMNAYGYCRDTSERALPKFGSMNIIKASQVPANVTRYSFTDPAGKRNWATIWVAVDANNPPNYYVYRDWPDAKRFGEWALPDDSQNPKADGKPGPGQRSLGYGFAKYKKMLLLEEQGEDVFVRYIDPRSGSNSIVVEKGGSCNIWELAKDHEIPVAGGGTETVPGMIFVPAPGKDEDEGLMAINALLDWDQEQPMVAGSNAPRLWVTEDCEQVIWAAEHYTGRDGQKAACKDFIDLLRYMATSELCYVQNTNLAGSWGGAY